MANKEHLSVLLKGVDVWNQWRRENPQVNPDLVGAIVSGKSIPLPSSKIKDEDSTSQKSRFRDEEFRPTDLSGANLHATYLQRSNLKGVILNNVDLTGANLVEADLKRTKLRDAKLISTNFTSAKLRGADLSQSDLSKAIFSYTDFTGVKLDGAVFTNAQIGWCKFLDINLSKAEKLETVRHSGPSEISISTLYRSGGNIPDPFLRGCGVPDGFITFVPSIIGAQQAIEFYSCFISFSSKDGDFCNRLYSRLRDANIRVWYAPEDIRAGQKIHEQIDTAIRYYDKMLIVLSENSLKSEWVITEIRKARKAEIRENRRKLFPIRLVNFETIQDWECFDVDTGKDMAIEVREYFIPDFSNWKEHDSFEISFDRLLRDLKAEGLKSSRV